MRARRCGPCGTPRNRLPGNTRDALANRATPRHLSRRIVASNRHENTACLLPLLLAALPARALYDDKPGPALAAIEGEWSGTLQYRDYQPPHAQVTLPARVFVVALGPDALGLHYIFGDGPGKVVHSYEQWSFDLAARTLSWFSGKPGHPSRARALASDRSEDATRTFVFDCQGQGETGKRYTLQLGARAWTFQEEEARTDGTWQRRNRYDFTR